MSDSINTRVRVFHYALDREVWVRNLTPRAVVLQVISGSQEGEREPGFHLLFGTRKEYCPRVALDVSTRGGLRSHAVYPDLSVLQNAGAERLPESRLCLLTKDEVSFEIEEMPAPEKDTVFIVEPPIFYLLRHERDDIIMLGNY